MTQRDSIIAGAWRWYVELLRSDPDLRSKVRDPLNIWAQLGEKWDRTDRPTDAQVPCIRITPSPGPSDWSNAGSGSPARPAHACPVYVDIETWVRGTDCTASMELWEAIHCAMYPNDATQNASVQLAMKAAHVTNMRITRPAWGSTPDGDFIKGTGSVTLEMRLSS